MLPPQFEERMKKLLGDSFDAFAKEYTKSAVRALRVNTQYIRSDALKEELPFEVNSIDYDERAFLIADGAPEKIGREALHHAGAFYVQEPSAMSPLACVEIKDGIRILDMCASPGGKSIQAAMCNPSGVIVSNEIVPARARTLVGNIERMGIKNAVVTNTDSRTLASWYDGVFDLVICDAPCSGEGMFRKNPVAVEEWSSANVKMCAQRQKEILDYAALTVAPGGHLLYSTCTFSLEENEMQVDNFLSSHPEFELCEVRDEVRRVTSDGVVFEGCQAAGIERCRRFYPHVSPGEGQFMALMRRAEDSASGITYKDSARELDRGEAGILSDFQRNNFSEPLPNLKKLGEKIYSLPDFPIPPFGVFAAGICVGGVEKGRLVPHHQLFSAWGEHFLRRIELDKTDAEKYVSGQTLSCGKEDGWCVLTVSGVPLGGGKTVSCCIKNHYPKGLRNK